MATFYARLTQSDIADAIADRYGVTREKVQITAYQGEDDSPASIDAVVTLPEPQPTKG